jgi:hypothetical protein
VLHLPLCLFMALIWKNICRHGHPKYVCLEVYGETILDFDMLFNSLHKLIDPGMCI